MESTKEMKINSSGFIPDNWREVTLGDHASVLRGGSPRPIEAYLTKVPDGINWIKIVMLVLVTSTLIKLKSVLFLRESLVHEKFLKVTFFYPIQ